MKMSDTKKINPLYQDIGADLNLGLLNSVDVIQTLWGGYGELVRLTFLDKSVIVKHVKLPKPSQHPVDGIVIFLTNVNFTLIK